MDIVKKIHEMEFGRIWMIFYSENITSYDGTFVLLVTNVPKVESRSILPVCGNKEGCDGIGVVTTTDRKSNVSDVDL
ncbi:hypothetical protein YC2023_025115 [Brassica napus]